MEVENPTEPYYAPHTMTRLTCPKCKGILNTGNSNHNVKLRCNCGMWTRTGNGKGDGNKWKYIEKGKEYTSAN